MSTFKITLCHTTFHAMDTTIGCNYPSCNIRPTQGKNMSTEKPLRQFHQSQTTTNTLCHFSYLNSVQWFEALSPSRDAQTWADQMWLIDEINTY